MTFRSPKYGKPCKKGVLSVHQNLSQGANSKHNPFEVVGILVIYGLSTYLSHLRHYFCASQARPDSFLTSILD